MRVIKIGGAALNDVAWLGDFASAVMRASGPLVVVHGGGPEITALSERLGLPVVWNGGRRVTPPEALDVASMVLNGRLNKRIVLALQEAGVDAVGLSGVDGGLVSASLVDGGALGSVGVVERVRVELLEWLTRRNIVPVISPISMGPGCEALNVNADEVATAIAAAAGASELLYITDVVGVSTGNGVRAELGVAEAMELIATGVAKDGMAMKLRTALAALDAGVSSVRIGRVDIVADAAAGTRVRQESEVLACR